MSVFNTKTGVQIGTSKIKIYCNYSFSFICKGNTKISGENSFSYTAFSTGNRDNSIHVYKNRLYSYKNQTIF